MRIQTFYTNFCVAWPNLPPPSPVPVCIGSTLLIFHLNQGCMAALLVIYGIGQQHQ